MLSYTLYSSPEFSLHATREVLGSCLLLVREMEVPQHTVYLLLYILTWHALCVYTCTYIQTCDLTYVHCPCTCIRTLHILAMPLIHPLQVCTCTMYIHVLYNFQGRSLYTLFATWYANKSLVCIMYMYVYHKSTPSTYVHVMYMYTTVVHYIHVYAFLHSV